MYINAPPLDIGSKLRLMLGDVSGLVLILSLLLPLPIFNLIPGLMLHNPLHVSEMMQRQCQLNFHKPSTASAHAPSRFSLHPQKLPLTHSPTLTRFHCHCLNWISISDMRYDAGQHKIMIACVYERVSDFHLLKIVHFRRVPHHKKHHAGWKWKWSPVAKLDYSIFWQPLLYSISTVI